MNQQDTGDHRRGLKLRDYMTTFWCRQPKLEFRAMMAVFHVCSYISGDNREQQKVAMTTPVFMQQGEMAFVVPEQIAAGGAPEPENESVQLRDRLGGKFAALRFSGRMQTSALVERENDLRRWMEKQNLVAAGPVEFEATTRHGHPVCSAVTKC